MTSLRIVVSGLITQHPRLGGISWHYLQYLQGLARLGHDVYYLEDSGEVPYHARADASDADCIADACCCGWDVRHRKVRVPDRCRAKCNCRGIKDGPPTPACLFGRCAARPASKVERPLLTPK